MQDVTEKLTKEESLQRVRMLVHEASGILRSLSSEHARLGWMLEDALVYLDEADDTSPLVSLEANEYHKNDPHQKRANTGPA